jgi:hypothetical protein
MKWLHHTAVLGTLLFGGHLVGSTPGEQDRDLKNLRPKVMEKLTRAELEKVLASKELASEQLPNLENVLIITVEGIKILLILDDDGDALQAHMGGTGTDATLEKVNQWNASKRFSRAYIDDDGDPVIELDLDLEGGITMARVDDFIDTVLVSVASFIGEVW